jgi:ribosomal protein S6--L-glutamate ligase
MIRTKNLVGWKEWFSLDFLGLPAIKGKIDTGAKTSSLHAFNIENFFVEGLEYVKFYIHPLQKNQGLVRECIAPVIDKRLVSDSSGKKEKRFVIAANIGVGKINIATELTLANRDSMSFRMLLGREALKLAKIQVDVSRSFLQGKLKKTQINKLYCIK